MKLSPKIEYFAIFMVLMLTQISSNQIFEAGYLSYAAIFVVGILASAMMVVQYFRANRTIHFSLIDLSFFSFVMLLTIRWQWSDNSWIYSKAAIAIVLVPIYIFLKHYKSISQIHWAIVLTGIVQLIVSILQKVGWSHNTNSSFEVGGTVGNPNILAMLLLFTVISAIYLLSQTRANLFRKLLWVYIAMALVVIFYTKCRTAILGSMVFGVVMMIKTNRNFYSNQIVKRVLLVVLGLMCLGFIVLIFEKSESITGRLLIWQVSFSKIAESPFWGEGISSFHRFYPDAQRIFLENNPNPAYLHVADTPKWAYNDFIELWLEGGLFVALSFLSILGIVLYCWKSQKRFIDSSHNIAFLSVTIFFVLSAFNFAITAWPILLIFVFNLAWSSSVCPVPANREINLKSFSSIFISTAFLVVCIYLGTRAFKNLSLQYQLNHIESLEENRQRDFFDNHVASYQYYAPFSYKYAAFLGSENKTCEAIAILQTIHNTQPSYQSALLLAENYQNINELKNAEINYEKAIKYLPNRILPRYHLFMIQLLMKNYTKADSIKKEVLLLDFKGDSQFINQIKESLCKYNINEKETDFNQ